MNKLLFVSLLIALPLTANAEKGDVLSGDIQQVVELPNMTKASIYNASRQWVATEFNSAQNDNW